MVFVAAMVIITGKKLTKFKTFNLYETDATTFLGAPQRVSATAGTIVLGLPSNLPAGTYVLVASDGKGTDESLTVTVGNGRASRGWSNRWFQDIYKT